MTPTSPNRARSALFVNGLATGLLVACSARSAAPPPATIDPPPSPEAPAEDSGPTVEDGFVVEHLLDAPFSPVRIAVGADGRVFVTGMEGVARHSGAVFELHPPEGSAGAWRAERVAAELNRPYGLAVHEGALYVSRSGQHTKWRNGVVEHVATGAVTRIEDLDGDGVFDTYHDVITGLPGARGPDYLHQNNAVVFDDEGRLYATSAINSDHTPPTHPWEGTVLVAEGPAYKDVRVYARGFRNPFGLTRAPDGRLFATDNDAGSGPLANAGDRVLLVEEGAHYGQPLADERTAGVSPPLAIHAEALAGVAWAAGPELPPDRHGLYAVSFAKGEVWRYTIEEVDGTQRAVRHDFARIDGAADIAAAPDGSMLVSSWRGGIFRIRPTGTDGTQP